MRFLDVLFYYYYRFYLTVFKDNEPSFTAKLALSACEAFLFVGVSSIFSSYFFCKKFGKTEFIAIVILVIFLNFYFAISSKREKEIIKNKPKLFNNDLFTIIVVWVFFLFTISILFWLNNLVNFILENCK